MKTDTASAPVGKRATGKQERRAAIVAAARQSFLENGYAATSMSGLLATLGGSKATLWSYFRSKEELFAAVIEELTQAFSEKLESELLSSGDDITATIVMFCRRLMDRIVSADGLATWRLVVSESGRFPEIGQIFYERGPHRIARLLVSYLDRYVVEGQLEIRSTAELAELLIDLCMAQQTKLLLGVGRFDKEIFVEKHALYFVDLFLVKRSGQVI